MGIGSHQGGGVGLGRQTLREERVGMGRHQGGRGGDGLKPSLLHHQLEFNSLSTFEQLRDGNHCGALKRFPYTVY